ncbi:hypothetical protein M406DRAFT_74891 [Cryphonectria parasitica EP155]|uniref:Uncharacterized protein n=1 Tax=Cryphonectria parasitica (strain ATCC 38755 / EP155) TaxID=660469 RepID=A0A9P4XW29_CRYP1|nr:uncharacterized protein M406DRAFT_74891 [Cryphonectria parasitica EP155]KAF3761971.1 hypothetical protein M406DRAFT_74891 [Cryphonectria parasitica EP155]
MFGGHLLVMTNTQHTRHSHGYNVKLKLKLALAVIADHLVQPWEGQILYYDRSSPFTPERTASLSVHLGREAPVYAFTMQIKDWGRGPFSTQNLTLNADRSSGYSGSHGRDKFRTKPWQTFFRQEERQVGLPPLRIRHPGELE